MAAEEGLSTNALIMCFHDEILQHRGDVQNFTSFLRVTCLRYLKRKCDRPGSRGAGQRRHGPDGGRRHPASRQDHALTGLARTSIPQLRNRPNHDGQAHPHHDPRPRPGRLAQVLRRGLRVHALPPARLPRLLARLSAQRGIGDRDRAHLEQGPRHALHPWRRLWPRGLRRPRRAGPACRTDWPGHQPLPVKEFRNGDELIARFFFILDPDGYKIEVLERHGHYR